MTITALIQRIESLIMDAKETVATINKLEAKGY
jgi:hypothetical protein